MGVAGQTRPQRRHGNRSGGVDEQANNEALHTGARLFSAYFLPDETKLWIITDAVVDEHGNRQATTLLLPEEY